jgi:hypothetical protein
MRALWMGVLGLFASVIGVVGTAAQAATANGPYYATPSWDQKLDPAVRFIVLANWSSQAVLDRETGLVWEQSPSPANHNWHFAYAHCVQKNVGNRRGWRMPTIEELTSLTDPTSGPLPAGHPFGSVLPDAYWSATTNTQFANSAWVMRFDTNQVLASSKDAGNLNPVWCVRGGQGYDAH